MLARERAPHIVLGREPELNEDGAEGTLVDSPALLAERFFQLRRCDRTGLDQAETDAGLIARLLANHAQKTDEVGGSEGLDDESGSPDRARERAVLGIVVGCQQHHADGSRLAIGCQLPAHREAIALVSFEVDIEQHYFGPMLAGRREALFGARGFEDRPALRPQRDSRGGAQSSVVVRDEDGRGIAASSSAERAEAYVVGLRAMRASLLALLNVRSSEPLVAYRLERSAQVIGAHDVARIADRARLEVTVSY